jgi:hypothetical protein
MIVIDATKEAAAAIREIFKNAYILMCVQASSWSCNYC